MRTITSFIIYVITPFLLGVMIAERITAYPKHLNPCLYEDGDNCWWDASTMGNGIGDSFVVIKGNKIWLNREQ